MEFGLKIGAVFSLADDKQETGDDCGKINGNDDHDHTLSHRNDNVGMDVCNTQSTPKRITSSRTHKSLSCVEDQDTPPSLLLEDNYSSNLTSSSLLSNLEYLSPPLLLPEAPLKKAISPEKKKCTKIAPCYIVLTNIDPTLRGKANISYRAFKRSFVECSNMCKKVMFRRSLKAGKDVFNVKTPSKQKDYLFYLMKEQEMSKKNKRNIPQFTKIQDIIKKHDLKVAARKNTFGKQAHPRVRRTVSKLPKDFAARPLSPLENQNMGNVSTEELEKLHMEFVKKNHELELNSLKRLIGIKRSLNQNLKKSKRLRDDGFANFLKSEVTSSVSGRVRKVNRKYGVDFAVCRKDFEEQRFFEVAQSQLKRAESESKRKKEEMQSKLKFVESEGKRDSKRKKEEGSIDHMSQKRRKGLVDPETEKSAKFKKVRTPLITIENPEKDDIIEANMKSLKSNNTREINKKVDPIRALLESPPAAGFIGNTLICGNNKKRFKKIHCKNVNKDAVLIQDLPKEEKVISGFLKETESQLAPKPTNIDYKITSESKISEHYGRTKQLLKDSIHRTYQWQQNISPKKERNISPQETEQEKFKVLKIPENVQQLFKPTEIKQEPPDNGYETVAISPDLNCSKVVKISYSNGLYKKVIMTVPTTASDTPPQNITNVTKPPHVMATPILVNTTQGLRYFVPNQLFTKLPSYSDAIKTKFLPARSVVPNSAPRASSSMLTVNTTNNAQYSNVNNIKMNSSQYNPQGNYLNPIPAVVQVPFYSSTQNQVSNVKPPSSTVVSQPLFNKSVQLTVNNAKSPICSTPKQNQTVIHKVSPAVQRNLEEKTPKLIQQQSVPIKNTTEVTGTPLGKTAIEKNKFYLLKIDGKNVLIPIDGNQAQPKAYVVDTDIINSDMQTKSQDSLATSRETIGISPLTEGTQPALLRCSSSSEGTQKQSTMVVLPYEKPGNAIVPTQLASSSNAASLSHSNLPKHFVMNVQNVSQGQVSNKTMLHCANNTVKSSAVGCMTAIGNSKKNESSVLIVPSSSFSVVKTTTTTAAFTNVVNSRNFMTTPVSVNVQSGLMQGNADSTKQRPISVVPVFLKTSDTPTVGSTLQSIVVPSRTRSLISNVGSQLNYQNDTNSNISLGIKNTHNVQTSNSILQRQIPSSKNLLVANQGQTRSLYTSVRGQFDTIGKSKIKTGQDITNMANHQADDTSLLKDNALDKPTQGQTISNDYANDALSESNSNNVCESGKFDNNSLKLCEKSDKLYVNSGKSGKNSGKLNETSGKSGKKSDELCEKSGKFEAAGKCNETVEKKATERQNESRPFKEAVSEREERLQRLRKLLKEKQKAVEEMRTSIPN